MTRLAGAQSFLKNPRRLRRVRWALILLAASVFIARWVMTILRPEGDFTLHWIFGRRFVLGGFLYAGGMHTPYPPFWAMASSLLTPGPMARVRAILYPLGLVPLALILLVLDRMTRQHLRLRKGQPFWTVAAALLLSSRFLIREFPECGANLLILALSWMGFYLWTRRKTALGGLSLGLAIALKCTPALFLLYFGWKRQWRMVATTLLFTMLLSFLPMVWMGQTSYSLHMKYWFQTVASGLSESHPVRGVLGDDETNNVALRPALGRLLVAVPPEHKSYVANLWRLQPLDLPPEAANILIKGVMALLLGAVLLRMGRHVPDKSGLAVAWEGAAISLLMLLYSPITWRQHCVGVLPAMYLISRSAVSRGTLHNCARYGLAVYVFLVLVLDRGVIGPEMTRLLDSYGATAWALLAVLLVAVQNRLYAEVDAHGGTEQEAAADTQVVPHDDNLDESPRLGMKEPRPGRSVLVDHGHGTMPLPAHKQRTPRRPSVP